MSHALYALGLTLICLGGTAVALAFSVFLASLRNQRLAAALFVLAYGTLAFTIFAVAL